MPAYKNKEPARVNPGARSLAYFRGELKIENLEEEEDG